MLNSSVKVKVPFSLALKFWRDKKGLTQSGVGDLIGYTGNAIGRIERGEVYTSTELFDKMAKALSVKANDLVYIDEAELRSFCKKSQELYDINKAEKIEVVNKVELPKAPMKKSVKTYSKPNFPFADKEYYEQYRKTHMNGNDMIFGTYDGEPVGLSFDNDFTHLNNNVTIIGSCGSGKTFNYLESNMLTGNDSKIVVTTSLYEERELIKSLKENGYKIYKLGYNNQCLTDEDKFYTIDFFGDMKKEAKSKEHSGTLIHHFVETIISNMDNSFTMKLKKDTEKNRDNNTLILTTFLQYHLLLKPNPTFKTLKDEMCLLHYQTWGWEEDETEKPIGETTFYENIQAHKKKFEFLSDKLARLKEIPKDDFKESVNDLFLTMDLVKAKRNILCTHKNKCNSMDLDVTKFRKEKSCLLINKAYMWHRQMRITIPLILKYLYTKLYETPVTEEDNLHVQFYLDEFPSFYKYLKHFYRIFSMGRKYNVGTSLFVMDTEQIKQEEMLLYLANSDTILHYGSDLFLTHSDTLFKKYIGTDNNGKYIKDRTFELKGDEMFAYVRNCPVMKLKKPLPTQIMPKCLPV